MTITPEFRDPRENNTADADTLSLLNEGVRLYPQATGYVLQIISLNLIAGRKDLAQELAEAGLRHARELKRLASGVRTQFFH